jgi:hypothetical protein
VRATCYLLYSLLPAALLSTPVKAQNGYSAVNSQLLPTSAKQLTGFVPAGWKIEQQLAADLNADKLPDQVLMLLEQGSGSRELPDARRLLLVLLAGPDGQWQRIGASQQLLLCKSCFGPMDGSPKLSFKQGALLVNQDAGSRYAILQTQRFRFEPTTKRMQFIGEERQVFDRTNPERNATYSTNLLTGKQSIKVGDESLSPEAYKAANRQRTFTLQPLYLEDVNNQENDTETLRWLPESYEKYQ